MYFAGTIRNSQVQFWFDWLTPTVKCSMLHAKDDAIDKRVPQTSGVRASLLAT